jgi:hypothetical protein
MKVYEAIARRTGTLRGRSAADLRAARTEVRTSFNVTPDADADESAPMSVVTLNSEADLQGVLADFAKTGGAALANVIGRFRQAARRGIFPRGYRRHCAGVDLGTQGRMARHQGEVDLKR